MEQGWIKLHRSLLNWEWYDDENTFRLFFHILIKANHKEQKWRGHTIKQGERLTSQLHLAEELGLSVRQVRTSLNKLKTTGELTVKTTNKYSLIKVNNWDKFQQDDRLDVTEKSVKRQSNDRQVTTNNNDKKEKNVNNEKSRAFAPPSIDEIKDYCVERNNSVNSETFYDFYSSKGWMVGKNKMKDWRACVRTWEKRDTSSQPEDDYINNLKKKYEKR